MFYEAVKKKIQVKTDRSFKRGEIIYNEGDFPESIFFIESGMVGLFYISESGKETFFRVFGKNDIFGHRSYFSEECYHASAVALSASSISSISKEECHRICSEEPELLKLITKSLARDLGSAEVRMAGLTDKTAHKRITESLVFLKLKYPDYLWTRKEIAEYSGSTFETVARVLTILENKGLIEKHGRDFTILNFEKMLSLTELELQNK